MLQAPMTMSAGAKKNVLIIGGSRFSGLYLFKELHDRVRGDFHVYLYDMSVWLPLLFCEPLLF
jgi:hypothetical protein